MATIDPSVMAPPQMAPQEGAAPMGPQAEEVFAQMRQNISPKEFSDEMLAGASQVDPQAVAQFKQELQGLDVSPEELEALNDLVDQILAAPEQYPQLREQLLQEGVPEDVLPEQFDPQFFATMNMAVDQMLGLPAGPQAFAKGGIAELKPIAKALADYGRNGDTMLAHITPAEARMLQRRGGSGTINPKTGLPEFFLKGLFKGIGKAFKSIGRAVKKFASSTVGRLVATVALGFFLGPAAASFLGVNSAVGVAAISGFVGSAGSTLLAGGNLRDALKAGAIGGLTAGAGAGVIGGTNAFASGSYTGPTTVGGQWDKFTNAISPGAPGTPPAANPAPGAQPAPAQPITPTGQVPNQAPMSETWAPKPGPGIMDSANQPYSEALANTPAQDPYGVGGRLGPDNRDIGGGYNPALGNGTPKTEPSFLDKAKTFYNENLSPSGIQEEGAKEALNKVTTQFGVTKDAVLNAPAGSPLALAYKNALPGIVSTYGPITAAGLGIMGIAGGFNAKPVQGGDITKSLMKPSAQRMREEGTQRQNYIQGLPGVQYDQYGEPLANQTGGLPTFGAASFGLPGMEAMSLPPVYTPPVGTMGGGRVAQPFNTASMYSNLLGPRYAEGGPVTAAAEKGTADAAVKAEADAKAAAEAKVRADALAAQQLAARTEVARQKAMQRAQGFGGMYANINAGLSALAPETNPYNAADTGFGQRNRDAGLAALRYTYGPMITNQGSAQNEQTVRNAYASVGRAGIGAAPNQVDAEGNAYWLNQLNSGTLNPGNFLTHFNASVADFMRANPSDPVTQYMQNRQGIATLADGGYPRRTGQISGPGTETSDSIPAMLSDGEFVMTAKAVRGAGKGSRRDGAKRMYKLMHQLEKNAERG